MLATVKGDVHDIGKNLVDIILTNNGYTVVNLGIKQPISTILEAAEEHEADAIGMSGLLVKSTVVMKENLEELNARGIAEQLSGAARRRGADPGVRRAGPARAVRRRGPLRPRRLRGAAADGRPDGGQAGRGGRGAAGAAGAPGQGPADACRSRLDRLRPRCPARSDVAVDIDVPTPPFWGDRIVKGIALADVASVPRRAGHLHGAVGAQGLARAGPSYEELVETEGRPRLRAWLDRIQTEGIAEFAVVYGYWPCYSDGNDLVVLEPGRRRGRPGGRAAPVHLPAAARGRATCAWPTSSATASWRWQGTGRGGVPPGHHGSRGVAR